jgi:hypothetical protein
MRVYERRAIGVNRGAPGGRTGSPAEETSRFWRRRGRGGLTFLPHREDDEEYHAIDCPDPEGRGARCASREGEKDHAQEFHQDVGVAAGEQGVDLLNTAFRLVLVEAPDNLLPRCPPGGPEPAAD